MSVAIPGAPTFDDDWQPPDEPPPLDDDEHHGPNVLTARLLHRGQLADLPTPAPLIADTIDIGTVAGLFGYWGSGKSFLGIDWACCIATGKPWQGRDVQQRKVLIVAAEGAYGLHARLTAWEAAWRHTIDPNTLHVLPLAVNLTKAPQVATLCDLIDEQRYGLVVIDTLARSIVGADENSAKDMGIVVDNLYKLRDAGTDTTIVPIHHTGKDKQTVRGSSALESGLDTIYLTEGDGLHIKLTRTKRKDGPVDDTMNLRIESIPTTTSAIIRYQGEDVRGHFDGSKSTQLMSTFVQHFHTTGASKAELRTVANMPPATFHRALSALVDEGRLTKHGTDQRPFYKQPAT